MSQHQLNIMTSTCEEYSEQIKRLKVVKQDHIRKSLSLAAKIQKAEERMWMLKEKLAWVWGWKRIECNRVVHSMRS